MRENDTASTPSTSAAARLTDPAYSALTIGAGSLLLLGTISTVAVSTLELAQSL